MLMQFGGSLSQLVQQVSWKSSHGEWFYDTLSLVVFVVVCCGVL